jgi:hypothetical protein
LKMTYQTKSDLIQVSRDLKMTSQTKSDLPSLERLDLLVNVRTNWPSGSSQGATQAEHT